MTALTLKSLALLTGARLEGDGSRAVTGPASLEEATGTEISFLTAADRSRLEATAAAAVVLGEDIPCTREDLVLLRCADPQAAFNQVVEAFAPERPVPAPGVHPQAVIEPGAEVDSSASVGPFCHLEAGVRIGAGAILHARVTIRTGASVGERTELHPGVVLYPHVSIGSDCILHAGSIIGADGFGFEPSATGWTKTPQGGTVEIADDVEIGANVTIDCARFKATRIGRGVKIDNLVHVAHNCQVGEGSMLVAQAGVAGSTRLGKRVILAGQAGLSGHLTIGDGAQIGGASAVFKDVPAGETWWGSPAIKKEDAIRRGLTGRTVEKLRERVRELSTRVRDLENRS